MHYNRKSDRHKITAKSLLNLFRTACIICCDYVTLKKCLMIFPRRFKLLKLKVVLGLIILISVFVCFLLMSNVHYFNSYTTPTPLLVILHKPDLEKIHKNQSKLNINILEIPNEAEFRRNLVGKKLAEIDKYSKRWNILKLINAIEPSKRPNTRVHIFFHTSYGNPEFDGKWKLWKELRLSSSNTSDGYLTTRNPRLNIGSNYYPQLGCYSSNDPHVMSVHMKQIYNAGIGVLIVSWPQSEGIISDLLDSANKFDLKVTFQLDMFKEYSAKRILYIIQNITKYTNHPALYKTYMNGKQLPVYYIFESYLINADIWRQLLASDGALSIRNTPYDGVFIGLLRDSHHKYHIQKSKFHGFYTYFPSNGYTYGSTWKNWKSLQHFAKTHKLLFLPTVSPGYIDTHGVPNMALTRHRSRGNYYQVAWRSAVATTPDGVTITSFNDWQHGSQIEPAIPKVTSHYTYLDYEPEGPLFYLKLTRYFVKQFMLQNSDDKENIIIT